jgi:hypothetical protein
MVHPAIALERLRYRPETSRVIYHAKIPRSRKWRVTDCGRRVMASSLRMREASFPPLYQNAAVA